METLVGKTFGNLYDYIPLKFPVTDYFYNGVDRVDKSIGYTKTNCVTCCSICNMSKRQLSLQEWLHWVDRIYTHQHTVTTFND